ncbi:hypothetical protein RclHR1_11550003 [Rhizophagus clarus]|uniref:Peptidase S8/S53 domain-containing protein n=1 Tax=Rhizophagus clarus TaxID=94130 RepID=A0A2Z6QJP2_9GLOM|nr:hypothetical protein RclHR1_11550003 [Rhizophagus clarus]
MARNKENITIRYEFHELINAITFEAKEDDLKRIDYLHSALGGCFGPGCKVDMDIIIWKILGIHVIIVGANDSMHSGFIGIAPRITFGAYRVMNCNGKGDGDVIMTSLQKTKDDGMNIINLSLGGNGWARTPLSEMADALTKYGIILVTANVKIETYPRNCPWLGGFYN